MACGRSPPGPAHATLGPPDTHPEGRWPVENETPPMTPPLCPSAQPHMEGSTILGVVGGTPEQPRLAYLAAPRPVTGEVLALSLPVLPTAVFRFGAPCVGSGCKHFSGSVCRLATRVVQLLPPVVDGLPACHLRPDCLWWQQEGKAACLRCPQVVTDARNLSELALRVADPDTPTDLPTRRPPPALPDRDPS